MPYFNNSIISGLTEPGGRGALALLVFGRSVNPMSTKRGRLCPQHYYVLPFTDF